jgi:dCTP deaminase
VILSGLEIRQRLGRDIFLDPFEERLLNPNSYNLRLHDELLVYTEPVLDMKRDNPAVRLALPPEGLVLEPGRLYLGRTFERTRTENLVPMLEGRSSVGRLGIFIHVTAGFGDVGFSGFWTLEIHCIQPVRIYPMVEICQIYYHTLEGDHESYRGGKYQDNDDMQTSRMFLDFRRPAP